jgi:hypothetical protein
LGFSKGGFVLSLSRSEIRVFELSAKQYFSVIMLVKNNTEEKNIAAVFNSLLIRQKYILLYESTTIS